MSTTSLKETMHKVQSTVQALIDEHLERFYRSTDEDTLSHKPLTQKPGLDYLHVKNSVLLSYLIDLVVHLKGGGADNENHSSRLLEMRTVLEKLKTMDAKLKYPIEKLLSLQSSTFAAAGVSDFNTTEDPLAYKPQLADEEEDDDDDEDDDDGTKDASFERGESKDSNFETIYQAPRLQAVPYTHDATHTSEIQQKRLRQRLRAGEIAQALRHEFTETPETEDNQGAGERINATREYQRMEQRQNEKRKYEEDNFVRLTVTRQEKKERKRLQRENYSNLGSLAANVDNLVLDRDSGQRHRHPNRSEKSKAKATKSKHKKSRRF
ncbi:U3 small nucleolar ribonucleoprotein protein LCP5 [Fistulifera solaris]|uniref:U3 small nucleolar ribonucleoprotein protein LCP5 n=1 Tax=Fistulifera solaris TaxID=1519565 RepID=A0A1Z5JD56_FISSO|nr:U3 small nucleolar ribonucleoprotein protein LCP5 [Fistulifera solaris]|eukprot:GAX11691.1 U3 small nucleolar ribonucleoprotein protein LCP5 [Fistulifera solaris]